MGKVGILSPENPDRNRDRVLRSRSPSKNPTRKSTPDAPLKGGPPAASHTEGLGIRRSATSTLKVDRDLVRRSSH